MTVLTLYINIIIFVLNYQSMLQMLLIIAIYGLWASVTKGQGMCPQTKIQLCPFPQCLVLGGK